MHKLREGFLMINILIFENAWNVWFRIIIIIILLSLLYLSSYFSRNLAEKLIANLMIKKFSIFMECKNSQDSAAGPYYKK
jgi:transposase